MRKSYEIAKLFGLELYQEFKLDLWNDVVFRLTETTLQSRDIDQLVFRDAAYSELIAFYCNNNVKIIKKKEDWRPSLNESYLTINLVNNSVDAVVWHDNEIDNLRYVNGLVYRLDDSTPKRILNKVQDIIENERFGDLDD